MRELSSFALSRFPARETPKLRAWDTADQYLLNRLAELEISASGPSLLVVNDSWGALAVALAQAGGQLPSGAQVQSWNDSWLSQQALEYNLAANDLAPSQVRFVPADQTPAGPVDLVLLKIPKNLAWWEDSLLRLRPLLTADAVILAGSMIKHTPRRAYTLIEECLGPCQTSLGWKKARLAEATCAPDLICPAGLPPATYRLETFDLTLHNQANVFSREKLDWGTSFLLDHLPVLDGEPRVLDLACGNGVLALAVRRRASQAVVLGIDESYQAIASARRNAQENDLEVTFDVAGDLNQMPAQSQDLVLCNPPFHQDHTVGDATARALFGQAHGVLKSGGELRIVANRHLGYHARLTELFGGCALVAENDKFVILSARRGQ
jgi:16S rRNA (guanine1207-N2)-methyltransferase